MAKDIAVFMPSRSNQHGCNKVIQMLYETCISTKNFDIVCIVDSDQIDLYAEVIARFPNVVWLHPEHKPW